MLRIKKLNVAIALFLTIILLLSVIVIPGSQNIPRLNSIDNKKTIIYPLGDNQSGISAILLDVKVQKVTESGGENNDWFREIKGYIGDAIRFRITIINNVKYDFSNLDVNIELSSEVLEYVKTSARVNGNPQEPTINGDNLTWEIDNLISNRSIIIEFLEVAIHETTIEGIESKVTVSANLDTKYDLELQSRREELNNTELEIQQFKDIKNSTKVELESINSTIIGLESKISENVTLLSEKQGLAENLSSEIIILNNSLSNNATELEATNFEISNIEFTISELEADLVSQYIILNNTQNLIQALSDIIATQSSQLSEKTTLAESLNQEIIALNDSLNLKNYELEQVNFEITELVQTISELESNKQSQIQIRDNAALLIQEITNNLILKYNLLAVKQVELETAIANSNSSAQQILELQSEIDSINSSILSLQSQLAEQIAIQIESFANINQLNADLGVLNGQLQEQYGQEASLILDISLLSESFNNTIVQIDQTSIEIGNILQVLAELRVLLEEQIAIGENASAQIELLNNDLELYYYQLQVQKNLEHNLTSEIVGLFSNLNSTLYELSLVNESIYSIEANIASLQNDLSAQLVILGDANAMISSLNNDLAEQNSILSSLETQESSLKQDIVGINYDLNNTNLELEATTQLISDINAAIAKLELDKQENITIREGAKAQIQAIEGELGVQYSLLTLKQAELDAAINASNESLELILELQSEIALIQGIIANLEVQLQETISTRDIATSEAEAINAELIIQYNLLAEKQSALENAINTSNNNENLISSLESELSIIAGTIADLQSQLATELTTLQVANDAIESLNFNLAEQNTLLSEQLLLESSLVQDIVITNDELNSTNDQLSTVAQLISETRGTITNLEGNLAAEISVRNAAQQAIYGLNQDKAYQQLIVNDEVSIIASLNDSIDSQILLLQYQQNLEGSIESEIVSLMNSFNQTVAELNQVRLLINGIITSISELEFNLTEQIEIRDNAIDALELINNNLTFQYQLLSDQQNIENNLSTDIVNIKNILNFTNDQLDIVRGEIITIETIIANLHINLSIELEKLETAKVEINNINENISIQKGLLAVKQAELNVALQESNESYEQILALQSEISSLEDHLVDLQNLLDIQIATRDAAITAIQTLNNQLTTENNNLQTQQNQRNTLISNKITLYNDLNNTTDQIETVQNSIDQLEADILSLEQQKTTNIQTRDTAQTTINNLNQQITEQQNIINTATQNINNLNNTINTAQIQLNDYLSQKSTLIQNKIDIQANINTTIQNIIDQDQLIAATGQQITNLQTQITQQTTIKNNAITTLETLNTTLQTENQQLQNYQNQESNLISDKIILNDNLNSTKEQLEITQQTIINTLAKINSINLYIQENTTIKNDAISQADIINGSIESQNILLDEKIADLVLANQNANNTDLLIQNLENEIDTILSDITDLQTQLDIQIATRDAAITAIQTLNNQLTTENNNLQTQQNQEANLIQDIADANDDINTTNNQLAIVRGEISSLTNDILNLQQQIVDNVQTRDTAQTTINNLNQQITEQQNIINTATQNINNLNIQINNTQNQINDYLSQKTTLIQQKNTINENINNTISSITEIELLINNTEQQITNLQTQITQQTTIKNNAITTLETLNDSIAIENYNLQLNQNAENNLSSEIVLLKDSLNATIEELNNTVEYIDYIEGTITNLETSHDENVTIRNNISEQISIINKNIALKNQKLAQLNADLEEAIQNEDYVAIVNLNIQIRNVENEIAALNKDLEAQQSNYFNITIVINNLNSSIDKNNSLLTEQQNLESNLNFEIFTLNSNLNLTYDQHANIIALIIENIETINFLEQEKNHNITIRDTAELQLINLNSNLSVEEELLQTQQTQKSVLVSNKVDLYDDLNSTIDQLNAIGLAITQTQSDLANLTQQKTTNIQTRDTAQTTINNLNQQITEQQNIINTATQNINNLNIQINNTQNQLDVQLALESSLLQNIADLNTDINNTNDQLDIVRQTITNIIGNIASINSDIADQITIKNNAINQADTINGTIDTKTIQLNNKQTDLNSAYTTKNETLDLIQSLNDEITIINGNIADLQSQLDIQFTIRDDAKTSIESLKDQLTTENNNLQTQQNQEANLIQNIKDINNDINATKDQIDIIRQTITSIQTNIDTINLQIQDNITIRDNAKTQITNLNNDLTIENSNLQSQLSQRSILISNKIDLYNNLNNTTDQIETVQNSIDQLEADILSLEQQKTTNIQTRDTAQTTINNLNQQITEQQNIINTATQNINNLNIQINNTQNQINDYLSQKTTLIQQKNTINENINNTISSITEIELLINNTEQQITNLQTQITQQTTIKNNAINQADLINGSIASNSSLLDSKQAELDAALENSNETLSLILALQDEIDGINDLIGIYESNLADQIIIRDGAISQAANINGSIDTQSLQLQNRLTQESNFLQEIINLNDNLNATYYQLNNTIDEIGILESNIVLKESERDNQISIRDNAIAQADLINASLDAKNIDLSAKQTQEASLVSDKIEISDNVNSSNNQLDIIRELIIQTEGNLTSLQQLKNDHITLRDTALQTINDLNLQLSNQQIILNDATQNIINLNNSINNTQIQLDGYLSQESTLIQTKIDLSSNLNNLNDQLVIVRQAISDLLGNIEAIKSDLANQFVIKNNSIENAETLNNSIDAQLSLQSEKQAELDAALQLKNETLDLIQTLESEISFILSQINSSESQLAEKLNIQNTANEMILSLNNSLSIQKGLLAVKQAELDVELANSNESFEQILDLQDEINSIQITIDSLESSKADQEGIKDIAVDSLISINSSLDSQNALLSEQLAIKNNLDSQISSLSQALSDKNTQLNDMQILINATKDDIFNILTDLDSYTIIRDNAQNESEAINGSITAKDIELQDKQSQKDILNQYIITLKNNIDIANNDLYSVRQTISDILINIDSTKSQLSEQLVIKNNSIINAETINSSIGTQEQLLQDKQDTKTALIQDKINLNQNINNTNDQLDLTRQAISNILGNIASIDLQMQENTTIKNNAINQAESINSSIDAQISLRNIKQVELDALLQESGDNLDLIFALQNEIAVIKGDIASFKVSLEEQNQTKLDAVNELQLINSSLEQNNTLLNERIQTADELLSDIITINDTIFTKKSDLNDVNFQITEIVNIIKDVKTQLVEANSTRNNTLDAISLLDSSISEQNVQLNDKKSLADTLMSNIVTINATLNTKKSELADIQQDIISIESNIADSQSNLADQIILRDSKILAFELINQQLRDLQAEYITKIDEYNELLADCQDIKTQLANPFSDTAYIYIYNNLVVTKKVWDGSAWEDEAEAQVNEIVRFNLSLENIGDKPIINITIIDILPIVILEYTKNATPFEPLLLDPLVWELDKLEMNSTFSIEFDALAIAEGVGINELYAEGLIEIGEIVTADSVYSIPHKAVEGKDTASVLVHGFLNNPPVANNDYATFDEDTSDNIIDVLANDSDPDEGDFIHLKSIETYPNHGIANIEGEQIVYSPESDFTGSDSLTYLITDSYGFSDTAQVFIEINNVNDVPVAVDDEFYTNENTLADFDVTNNDYDVDGDYIILDSIEGEPANGTASIVSNMLRYEPENGFIGLDIVEYKIIDGNGGNDTAILTIIVNNVNDPPVANDDQITVYQNTISNIINVLNNDDDPDGDTLIIHSIDTLPTNGTAIISGDTILYTPDEDYIGTDSFVYNITDGNGEYDTAFVLVNIIEENIVNEPPNAQDDYITVSEDDTITILNSGSNSVLDNDTDPNGDDLTASLVSGPSFESSFTLNLDGTFSYVHDGSETISDSFIYQASDGNGGNDTATVYITIIPVNDPPVANDDSVKVYFNSSNNVIDVLSNDNDPDDIISINSIDTYPTNGTVEISGDVILYTPDEKYIGTDSFVYNITDGNGEYDTAKVTVTVVRDSSGSITKPEREFFYIKDKALFKATQLLRFIDAEAIVIGPITVNFVVNDSDFITEKVEFYIDGELKNTTTEAPYEWTFNERFLSICTIKAVAYGTVFGEEFTISNEINVLVLNFGFNID